MPRQLNLVGGLMLAQGILACLSPLFLKVGLAWGLPRTRAPDACGSWFIIATAFNFAGGVAVLRRHRRQLALIGLYLNTLYLPLVLLPCWYFWASSLFAPLVLVVGSSVLHRRAAVALFAPDRRPPQPPDGRSEGRP